MIIAAAALLVGAVVNWARAKPLPLRYQSPAMRLTTAPSAERIEAQLISFEETREIIGRPDVVVLDARSPVFFEAGHLPGAVNLPHDEFARNFQRLESVLRQPGLAGVIIYCSGGECEDSAHLAGQLSAKKIGPLAIFEGGWEEWIARIPVPSP